MTTTTTTESVSPLVSIQDVSKSFHRSDSDTLAISGLTFQQNTGEFLVVVGPSGCGKTTLLRMISGLVPPSGGQILHRGENSVGVPSWLAVVFQEYNRSLFPWLSVLDNVTFPLFRLRRNEARDRANEALELVGLEEFADHYPWQLSGGMQQRVAIARGMVAEPELLLMDEPFASVDAQTRIQLEDMVLQLWRRLSLSVMFVTHDIDEAIYLADRVVVLSKRPSRVVSIIDIDLPRPRDQLVTKSLPRFHELRTEAYRLIGVGRSADE